MSKGTGAGWDAVVHKEATAGTWVICDSEANEIASGTDGLGGEGSETAKEGGLVGSLALDKVLFCAFLVHGIDEKESVVSTRPKMVKINWVGPSVKPMQKMKALSGKAAIAKVWQGFSVEIDATKLDEVEHDDIKESLLQCGGAHKPNSYDFGDKRITFEFHNNKAHD